MRFFALNLIIPILFTGIGVVHGAAIAGDFASACPLGERAEKCRLQANKSPLGVGRIFAGQSFKPRAAAERGSFCYKPYEAFLVQASTACCGSVRGSMHNDWLCVGLKTNVAACSQFHRCCRIEYHSGNSDDDKCY
ncbi:hypothetical protein MAC_07015 [Metarhizium acridum CQMa 102]|uniref:Uncharacterized protein n=1 Tax=Metarhizium acridum (strain CQMa 102) TaxID=655827 RepID=E9EAW7_METAQ|nr:uncharacterized protein MAC_07015 [Metarhizium acridum CQMa 102]EFY86898.1 hypothetical protein MAC_07015 [Metarhizium acridum CQMa 102]